VSAKQAEADASKRLSAPGTAKQGRQTPSDNSATEQDIVAELEPSSLPANLPLAANRLSDGRAAGLAVTLSRRKNPRAFNSAVRLRETIDPKNFRDKKALDRPIPSVEDLAVIHKAAEAQIQELKRIKTKNSKTITELRAENTSLRRQASELERALNHQIAAQDKIVNERCVGRQVINDGLLRNNVPEVSKLKQELMHTKAAMDVALRNAWREMEIMQEHRDGAREELETVKKGSWDLKEQITGHTTIKPRTKTLSRNSSNSTSILNGLANADHDSVSDDDAVSLPRFSRRTRARWNLRDISSSDDIEVTESRDADSIIESSSDVDNIPSSSPYKPPNERKRKRSAANPKIFDTDKDKATDYRYKNGRLMSSRFASNPEHEMNPAISEELEQRDKEAIREAKGLRGRTAKQSG